MTDVVIVGGGPAGLAAAIHAAQAGLQSIIFEPKNNPIDKACGEGLMPPTLRALDTMNVPRPEGYPFVGIRYVDGNTVAEGQFSMGPGLGVRRTTLQQALRHRVENLGIEIREERVQSWNQDENGVTVNGVRSQWMIAADGLQSSVRRQLSVTATPTRPPRLGIRRHFKTAPWSPYVEIHWSPTAEAYVTPISEDTIGVAILYYKNADPPEQGDPWDRWIQAFPKLYERLGQPCTAPMGAGPFEQRVTQRTVGRILLIGDAAGYLDPITGEGIRLGFETAQAAIECIASDNVNQYEQAWRRIARRYWWLTSGLLTLRERPFTRSRLVPTLKTFPSLFNFALNSLNHA
ncbi:MAG: monooxygenase [Deltaproteobacteria bacterium]|nr:monooxygenase [Deltaproteobacteria bacterium]